MGAIRGLIEQFDASGPNLEDQKQIIEALATLAEAKADYFELVISTDLRTAGSAENLTIPVEAVLDSITETHAYASKNADAIGATVGKALKTFCSGSKDDILTGVGSLISDSLSTFLGAAHGSDTKDKKYYVMTEGLSIVRVDILAWQFDIDASSITSLAEKVSAFVAVKSAVDLNKVKFNTFLNIYSGQLEKMQLEDTKIQAALKDARDIFAEFKLDPARSNDAPLLLTDRPR